MTMQVIGHLRPDLIDALVNAITNLVYSKQAVINLFRNSGVPDNLLHDYQDQINRDRSIVKKPIMARAILERMNAVGDTDAAIRMRRELVRRVVEWKDFSSCPPNCQDTARGAVARVMQIAKMYDFLTEVRRDRERQVSENIKKVDAERTAIAKRKAEFESIKADFFACFGITDHHKRGYAFESVMNRLFVHGELAARGPFTIRSQSGRPLEQIDGSIELERFVYLIEIKWWEDSVDQKELSAFGMKVFLRDEKQVRGIVVSASNFTEGAIEVAKEAYAKGRAIILMSLKEFFDILQVNGCVRRLLLDRIRIMNDEKKIVL